MIISLHPFDRIKGTINIYRSNGIPLLTGGTACINTDAVKRIVGSANYKHTIESTAFTDSIGFREKIIGLFQRHGKDKLGPADSDSPYASSFPGNHVTEAILENIPAGRNMVIKSLEPVRVLHNEGAVLNCARCFKVYHERRNVL